ncbi:hypothetical protein SESBI_41985 [Sesbania bispinosa]|nr:hypothetical protein SESBI_41985 [Sesbania bispinosa]
MDDHKRTIDGELQPLGKKSIAGKDFFTKMRAPGRLNTCERKGREKFWSLELKERGGE